MASLRERGKVWYYKFVAGEGRAVEPKGCSDKRATASATSIPSVIDSGRS
jgi:hypothetical protein